MKVVCGIDLMDIIGNVVDLIMERLGRWRERLFMMKTMFPLTTADRFSAGGQVLGGVWTVSLSKLIMWWKVRLHAFQGPGVGANCPWGHRAQHRGSVVVLPRCALSSSTVPLPREAP